MPTFNGSETYSDGNALTKAQLTALVDSIEAFLNTTKLDSDNIQTGGISTANLADASVTAAKLASAVAGAGLTGGAGTALSVVVDDSTIEIDTDTLRVKDSGITTAKINDDAVTAAKVEDNINLPGKTVKLNDQMAVSSANTAGNGLMIVRGIVTAGGTVSFGEGYTSAKDSEGNYTITFSSAFAFTPAITVTITSALGQVVPFLRAQSASAFSVNTQLMNGSGDVDCAFHFIATGPRS